MPSKISKAGKAGKSKKHGKKTHGPSKITENDGHSSKRRNVTIENADGDGSRDDGEILSGLTDLMDSKGEREELSTASSTKKHDVKTKQRNILYRCIFLEPLRKVWIYVTIVAIGCAIHDLTDPPETYFSDKNNFLNQYFVKLSWGWTCGVALVFLLPASYIVRNGDGWKIAKDSLRLVVGTLEWYCWVGLFFWIEDATGQCSGGEQYSTKKSCVRSGHQWDGYDISGHTFLLIHCALLVWEELSYYMKLETRSKSKSQIKKKPYLHLFVRFTVMLMTLLALLWEFMLVWTQVYFHTTSHKAIALAVALGNWYITYRVLYGKLFPDMHTRITGKEGKPVL